MQVAKVLARLCVCAGSSESWLVVCAISSNNLSADIRLVAKVCMTKQCYDDY